MCVTNTTGRRPLVLSFGTKVVAEPLSAEPSAAQASRVALPVQPGHQTGTTTTTTATPASTVSLEESPSPSLSGRDCTTQLFSSCFAGEGLEDPSSQPKKKRRRRQRPGLTAKRQERHFVHHNYHDHAFDLPPPTEDDLSRACGRRRGGVAGSFPQKLHQLLDQIEADGLSCVISWQPHGRCFVIHKPKEFTEHVMPKYFRQTKLTSFQRQLNLYGFQRLTKGPDDRGYYHELFLKGRPFLCERMVRTKVKGTRFKAASSPEEEPDFYSMPRVLPLDAISSSASDNDSSSMDSDLTPLLEPTRAFTEQEAPIEPFSLSSCEPSFLDAFEQFPVQRRLSPIFYQNAAQNSSPASTNPAVSMAPIPLFQGRFFADGQNDSLCGVVEESLVSNPDETVLDFVSTWLPCDDGRAGDDNFDDDTRFGFLLESLLSE